MKIIGLLKKIGEFLAIFLLLYLCWTIAFFLTPWLLDVFSINGLSFYMNQIINSFLGFFLFGLIMYGISLISFVQEKQSRYFRPMVDAMKNMAQGNFNVDLSWYKKQIGNRKHPFHDLVESITQNGKRARRDGTNAPRVYF
ncbi:hypothetical protein [Peribacillus alkalitolerans]|uniref:hypothetical protein n=1 Tax=Peribacillus alkalitolerans TaxID=1550385 RepID=UPI0013D70961